MAGNERKAPLASLEDFSSIYYYSPNLTKKLSDFSTPLLGNSENSENIELVANNENFENIAKLNANRKLTRPFVKVPKDRSVPA